MKKALSKISLFWLIPLSIVGIFSALFLVFYHFDRKETIASDAYRVRKIEKRILEAYKAQTDFFLYESSNPKFFETGRSSYFEDHESNLEKALQHIDYLRNYTNFGESRWLIELEKELNLSFELFTGFRDKLLERGFKDWGIVGRMRIAAHGLEELEYVDAASVLMLRRHEKDYIIRNDSQYIEKFRAKALQLRNLILLDDSLTAKKSHVAASTLKDYVKSFNEMITVDGELGFKDRFKSSGLKRDLKFNHERMMSNYRDLESYVELKQAEMVERLEVNFAILVTFFILTTLLVGYLVYSNVSAPITRLSSYLNDFVESNFSLDYQAGAGSKMEVIDKLCRNVDLLKEEIQTKIKQLEKEKFNAEKADRLKSAFLANMSHDIRTPMNAIIGFSNLISDKKISEEEEAEYLDYIRNCGRELLNLVDDIIDISKIEAETIRIDKRPFKFNRMLKELSAAFNTRKEAERPQIVIKKNLDIDDPELAIKSDENRIRQIFNNLLSNALKFTSFGYIELGYRALRNENGEIEELVCYVKDTGIGIPPDKQAVIFERFGQADITHSTQFGGTGLGLAISKKLAELLGGHMWVESVPGEGSTFSFTLPFVSISPQEIGVQESFLNTRHDWSGRKMLIAEDSQLNFILLKRLLEETNIQIVRVENGKEAVEYVENGKNEWDLVLMDLKMPEMDGFEATRRIKSTHADLPVIAQTASGMSEEIEQCVEVGCDGFIGKPYNKRTLLTAIDQTLKRKWIS